MSSSVDTSFPVSFASNLTLVLSYNDTHTGTSGVYVTGSLDSDHRANYGRKSFVPESDSSLTAPGVTGYTFDGWYTYPSDSATAQDDYISRATTRVSFGATIDAATFATCKRVYAYQPSPSYPPGDYFAAAIYRENSYSVNYALLGGEHGSTHPSSSLYSSAFTVSAPTRAGYTFAGWTVTGDLSSAAKFYDGSAWQSISSSSTKCINASSADGDVRFRRLTGGSYVTLTANWATNERIALLNTKGGVLADGTDYFLRVEHGSAYGTLPTPTRSGYTFDGWFTAETGGTVVTAQTIVMATASHTLYAHWTAVAANVTLYFDAAGGTVSPTSRQVTEGQAYGTLPTPTRSGYTFAGWYTRATGGDAVTAQTVAGDEDVTIYAHWTGESLTITFNANGGTVSEASRTVVRGSQYKRLPIPVRDGYNFDGWYTAATGGTLVTAGDYPSASTTLYAHWSNGTVPWLVVTTW